MNGLVSGYGSDSEGDENLGEAVVNNGAEKNVSNEQPEWSECYDESSGYIYYWNFRTNETRWDKPEDFVSYNAPVAGSTLSRTDPSSTSAPPLPASPSTSAPNLSSIDKSESKLAGEISNGARANVKSELIKNSQPQNVNLKQQSKKGKKTTFIGPILPELSAEEIARQKVLKFEEDLANSIIAEIQQEIPLDWTRDSSSKTNKSSSSKPAPKFHLYKNPLSWKKNAPLLPLMKAKEEEYEKKKDAPTSISLIAGVYGDHSDQDTDEEELNSKTLKRKMQIKVKAPPSKQPKMTLKPVPKIFQQSSDTSDDDDGCSNVSTSTAPKNAVSKDNLTKQQELTPQTKERSSDEIEEMEREFALRRFIEKKVEILSDKLEILNVNEISISGLKIVAVKIQVLFSAWQHGSLTSDYFKDQLTKISDELIHFESHEMAPPGWKPVWDRSRKRYLFENLVTGEFELQLPAMEPATPDENSLESSAFLPPLPLNEIPPPLPPSTPPLPPLPPPPPPLPTDEHQGPQDMELSDDDTQDDDDGHDDTSQSNLDHIKPPPINNDQIELPPTLSEPQQSHKRLSDVLQSFYSDIASIEVPSGASSAQVSYSSTPSGTPPLCQSPRGHSEDSPMTSSVASRLDYHDDRSNSPFRTEGDDNAEKRKKKSKLSTGLSMKKKGVDTLVAKWQNIQEENKRLQK